MGITSPLEVAIQNVQYGSTPLQPINILGIARGAGFASYVLEYGSGTLPPTWTLLQSSSTPAAGVLGQFDPSVVVNGTYTIRLTAYNVGGTVFTDRTQVLINTLSITTPTPSVYLTTATSYKSGTVIPIVGTVAVGGFQSYQVQWAAGAYATSGWQNTGITVTGSGQTPVISSQLAAWDTRSIMQAGYYTLRVTVTSSLPVDPVTTNVYLQPDLVSAKWPVWLDVGFRFNVGLVPAQNADGSVRFMLSGSDMGPVPGVVWTLEMDGTSQKTSLPNFWGDQQPLVGNLDTTPGEEAVYPYATQMRVFHQDSSSYWFNPTQSVDFSKHPPLLEDLNGSSELDTIAVGNDYNAQMAYVYAWRPTGELVNGNFPIQVNDLNPLVNWINHERVLVGDFKGDGKNEIVVQNGLSATTYTLSLFAANGAPLSWNVPVLSGIPMGMIAADLDHNGKLETIIVTYSGSQATLDVFQPDGSERPGWPQQVSNPNQYAQVYLAAGDLDRNGQVEIVFSHETELYVFKADGTKYSPAWPLLTGTQGFNAVAIGDVDGDGYPEIVTVRNDVVAKSYFDQKLLAIRRDGTTARSWQLTGMNGYDLYVNPMPVLGDFNQDGIADIAVAYDVTGKGSLAPGVVTILSTGTPYQASAMDWPMLWRNPQSTAVFRALLESTTAITSSANPSVVGQTVSFRISVASAGSTGPTPTGAVYLQEETTPIGSCVLVSGVCQITTASFF